MNDKQEQYRGGRQVLTDALGKPRTSKTDEFSEKFRRAWVIFNPKIYIAKFGPLDRTFSA